MGSDLIFRSGNLLDKFRLETKYLKRVEKVVNEFGGDSPAQLEVKATIHFVHAVIKRKNSSSKTKIAVVQKVHELKPRFTEDFIRNCYSNLEQAHWI